MNSLRINSRRTLVWFLVAVLLMGMVTIPAAAFGKSAKITVTGYADSGTGTADGNKTLSEQRAATVVSMLKKAGIAASRISSAATGSDKDVSASPESNRVAVCIVK